MDQYILAITSSEIQSSQGTDDFRRDIVNTKLKDDVFTLFINGLIDFLGRPLHDLFYPCGMDPPVRYETLERYSSDFLPYWVETRYHYGLGGVIDYDIHSRQGF